MGSTGEDQYSDPEAKRSPVSKCQHEGFVTYPAKSKLCTKQQRFSNFPLNEFPVPSMLLGITASYLYTVRADMANTLSLL